MNLEVKKINYIKVSKIKGRMGHQLAEWNTALSLSVYFEINFIHTPLGYGWEKALNFGKDELTEPPLPTKTVKLPNFNRSHMEEIRATINSHKNSTLLLDEGQNLENHWLTEGILKSKWKHSPINKPFKKDEDKIGVHIRRGDVTKNAHPNRWVNDETYIKIIDSVLATKNNTKVHIFSEGKLEDFKAYEKYSPNLHINGSEFETFNKMTKCETLITGKSAFSYFASILSSNNIIAIPFWHEYPNQKRILTW